MPYSNHTMVKSRNTLVKTEERNKAAQVTFQTKKKKSCICKCILVIFILAGLVTSTIFLMHFLSQKLNLDQDYSKQLASKFVFPSFSSLRTSDAIYSTRKESNYQDKSQSSQETNNDKHSTINKLIEQPYPKFSRNSNKKRKNQVTFDSDSDNDSSTNSSSRYNFTNMQFWNYFKAENAHLHPNRVRKTDISNEESTDVHLTIPQYAILKGVRITEFGNKMYKFLNIPYAKAPINELRFKEPVEYKPKSSDTVLDNTKFGPICPQFFDEILVKTVTPLTRNMSEDCLALNVWTPQLPKSNNVNVADKLPSPKSTNNLWTILTEDTLDFEEENTNKTVADKQTSDKKTRQVNSNENLLPVMVWIHGGGFSMGSTALDEYDGSVLSAFGHVVVVTINYRLGIFGFFNLNTEHATGNQGLKDQVLALKWVKKHIKNFGGDPNKITIFGQSAGGFAVGLHMISPNSKGLFRRAILQSGSPLVFDQFYQNTFNIAKRLVQYVDCEEKDELLESLPADISTEANMNEEENEEENTDDESSDDSKNEEKLISSSGTAFSEMKSNLGEESFKRRKRADDENDDDDGEDEPEEDEKKSELTTVSSIQTNSISTQASSSLSTSTTSTTTTTTEKPVSSTVDNGLTSSSSSSTTSKPDDDEDNDDNEEDSDSESKNESKSSTVSAVSSSTTEQTTTSSSTTIKPTEKTFFTNSFVSSTSTSPTLSKKLTKAPKNPEDDIKRANKILKCMQSKTMKTLIKAQKNAMQNSMFPFSPNKHDSILPKMPGEVIKQDVSSIYFHTNVEQVLLGVNKDEGSLYLHLTMPQLFPSENLTLSINKLSDLRAMLANNLTNAFKVPRAQATIVANLLLSNGPEIDTTENLVRKYYQLIADLMFNCPTVMLADELVKLNYQNDSDKLSSAKKKQVYFYRFNERPSVTNWGEWFGVTHHEEVQFVFGMPLKYPLKYNSKDLIFSKRIMKTWAHFAKTGEMLPQLDLQWPAYNKQQQLMELSAFESKVTEKLHEKNCNLFRIGFESFMKRRKRFVYQQTKGL